MRRCYTFIFLWCLSVCCNAQSTLSPYKLSLSVDISLSANAASLLGASYLVGNSRSLPPKESLQGLDRNTINKFDRGVTKQYSKTARSISDATLFAGVALPALFLIQKITRKEFGKIAVISAETFVVNLAVTDLIKEVVKRKRPLMYNPNVPFDTKYKKDNFKSFFSGHTSTVASMSFCFAMMYSGYNPNSKLKPVVWSLCAALPIATALLRVKGGKHFWTDVIAGYAAGALIGVAVPYLHSTQLKFNRQ